MDIQLDSSTLNGWQVVLIDDEPDSLEVVEFLLERHGATVYMARDGASGLQLIREVRPHFVISDLAMPRMTGEELAATVQQDGVLSQIPLIALSAHARQEDYSRAIAAGFHGFMPKPLRPERFVRDVLRLLLDVPHIAHALNAHGGA